MILNDNEIEVLSLKVYPKDEFYIGSPGVLFDQKKRDRDKWIEGYKAAQLKLKIMTKEQQFKQEDQRLNRAMDLRAENITKLKEDNAILIQALKEIAVRYPENMSAEQDNILVKYLIVTAQEAIRKVEGN